MKTSEKNILIAFLLNISFSIIELVGGFITNSVAIISDSIHDFGDAISIGISYFMERKSKQKKDNKYTYGYIRYSVLGSAITTSILLSGSILVIINSIKRIINPVDINYKGMIIISIIGIILNSIAAYKTKDDDSLNQKSVNLHMLEDTIGWIIVFIGSIIMNFTNISIIDSIMSIALAIFILVHALENLKSCLDVFLEKVPNNINIKQIEEELMKIEGIEGIHHIHIWSIDGINSFSTLHVVTKEKEVERIKENIRKKLYKNKIIHTTIEIENKDCSNKECNI